MHSKLQHPGTICAFSKPDDCLWIRTTQFITSMTNYMLKIDASFGERKNGIRTQDLLNTNQTLLATASLYRWAQPWTQHRRIEASLHIAAQDKGLNWFRLPFSHTAFILSKIPCRQHNAWADTLTTHHHSLWQNYLPMYCTTGIKY